jgi:hypothetical protein
MQHSPRIATAAGRASGGGDACYPGCPRGLLQPGPCSSNCVCDGHGSLRARSAARPHRECGQRVSLVQFTGALRGQVAASEEWGAVREAKYGETA